MKITELRVKKTAGDELFSFEDPLVRITSLQSVHKDNVQLATVLTQAGLENLSI
jgi:hypothetical protein